MLSYRRIIMSGRPVPIVVQNNDSREFELDEDALKNVLLSPDVGDKPVCVVAVAGAFRQGKSFLLNHLVKYCENKGSPNWLGDPSLPLEGFAWRSGIEGETTGIYIWSKPFVFTKPSGDEVAVILMDTQGTFDCETTMQDSTFIFALTLLTSSVTVYNLMHNIREDDLMNLQTFCTFGTMAQNSTNQNSCAFQKLLFLVRDWNSPKQYPYGHQSGKTVLDKILTAGDINNTRFIYLVVPRPFNALPMELGVGESTLETSKRLDVFLDTISDPSAPLPEAGS
ncbi:atlastin-3-like [Hyalella azteca]|uniref:Atlastin-3-like n=1 Tax=Hyalella azteca TaxID=294128 RepID=A0A8B7N8E3_HYAAZ|nr:atlastin-3-like [Hyalella azteca]